MAEKWLQRNYAIMKVEQKLILDVIDSPERAGKYRRRRQFDVEVYPNGAPDSYAVFVKGGTFWATDTREPLKAAAGHLLLSGAAHNDLLVAWANRLSSTVMVGTAASVPLAGLPSVLREQRGNEARFEDWKPVKVPRLSEHLLAADDVTKRQMARLYSQLEKEAPVLENFWQRYERGGRTTVSQKDDGTWVEGTNSRTRATEKEVSEAKAILRAFPASPHELQAGRNDRGRNKAIGSNTGKTLSEQRALALEKSVPGSLRLRNERNSKR
jgi:hypothetical protein